MLPILFSIGSFHFYSLSFFLLLSWIVFSFTFWQLLRDEAVPEERIFDLTFYTTIAALLGGRVLFIILNPGIFEGSLIKMLAIWVVPGLSFWGALTFAVATLVFVSRRKNVRLGYILDALSLSLPISFIPGAIGAMLDGAQVGLPTKMAWAVRYVGFSETRHPVGLYEVIVFILMVIFLVLLRKRARKLEWPYGLLGIWFFFIFTLVMFGLEFIKVNKLYFKGLSVNQWLMIGIFAETIGAFYVRGGGREKLRFIIRNIYERIFKRSY